MTIHGGAPNNNTLSLTAGNAGATFWLSPELVDFDSSDAGKRGDVSKKNTRVNLMLGGRRANGAPTTIKPSVETMLEDLRVRGDRQHPFWAKVEAK